MSSWGDWFEDVWDALVAKVKTISDFGNEKVFWGRKFPVTAFPSAFVCPNIAEAAPITFRETIWNPVFVILIAVEQEDSKTGVITAWKLAGNVIDVLEADRTLSGLLSNLECGPVIDSPERLGLGLEQHWVGVTIRCTRKR